MKKLAALLLSALMLLTLATGCGGNACNANPSADAIHGLILNDAMAVIASAEGVREIPILELFAGPGKNTLKQGELLLRFEVPKPAPHTGAAYTKFAIRGDSDIAIVGTGALLTLSDDGTVAKARVSLGAVAPTPIRAAKTEAHCRQEADRRLDPGSRRTGRHGVFSHQRSARQP